MLDRGRITQSADESRYEKEEDSCTARTEVTSGHYYRISAYEYGSFY